MWAIIAGIVKAYNFTLEYVLYDLSYANMILLGAVLPSYNPDRKSGKGDKQDVIKADDPANRGALRTFLENCE